MNSQTYIATAIDRHRQTQALELTTANMELCSYADEGGKKEEEDEEEEEEVEEVDGKKKKKHTRLIHILRGAKMCLFPRHYSLSLTFFSLFLSFFLFLSLILSLLKIPNTILNSINGNL